MLTNPDVADRIAELRGVVLAKHEVTLDWWIENVKAIAELPRKAKKLADKVAAAKVAVIATDQIAQHLGAFRPKKVELSGPGGAPIATEALPATGKNPSDMSDEELRLGIEAAATVPNLTSETPTPPQS